MYKRQVLVVAVVIRHEGKPVLDFAEIAKTGANWNILMLSLIHI